MMEQKSLKSDKEAAAEDGCYVCEPGDGSLSTAGKDIAAAGVIIALSLLFMILAVCMPNPDTIFTHPGLLPFSIGLTLILMAVGLTVRAIRLGGVKNILQARERSVRTYFADLENRRTFLVIGIIILYVVLVDFIAFDLRLPAGNFVFHFSSFELISIIVLSAILRIFWRGTLKMCFLISACWIIVLASAFRYAFHILMPGLG